MATLKERLIELGDNSDYQLQGDTFLKWTNTRMGAVYSHTTTQFVEGQLNYVFNITLSNENHVFCFPFTQSVVQGGTTPNSYDVLTCLTKYDVESFEDFCSAFGYEEYNEEYNEEYTGVNKESKSIYEAVKNEWYHMNKLFTEEQLEALQEVN